MLVPDEPYNIIELFSRPIQIPSDEDVWKDFLNKYGLSEDDKDGICDALALTFSQLRKEYIRKNLPSMKRAYIKWETWYKWICD